MVSKDGGCTFALPKTRVDEERKMRGRMGRERSEGAESRVGGEATR